MEQEKITYKFNIYEVCTYPNNDTSRCHIGEITVKALSATKAFPVAFEQAKKYFAGKEIELGSPKCLDENYYRLKYHEVAK